MRKYFIAMALIMGTSMPQSVFATDVRGEIKDLREAKKEVREERKDVMQEWREKTNDAVKRVMGIGKAAVIQGNVTAKTETSLTVEKDGKSYTVNLGADTKLRRRFGGTSSASEFSVGNTINVYGMWTDDTKTAINARLIRNISIQKRFGVFVGDVKSLTSGGWVMSTLGKNRPDQAITVSTSTQIKNRKEETISQNDVKVGHRVRVKGLWDSSANTVTEVTHVKDFSLPVVDATISVTATATPTP